MNDELTPYKTIISEYRASEKNEYDETLMERDVFSLLEELNRHAYQEIDRKFFSDDNDDGKKEK